VAADDFSRAYLDTLLRTERLPAAELAAYQSDLLRRFLDHAGDHAPFYRGRLPRGPIDVESESWLGIPTIDRATLGRHVTELAAERMPEGHGQQERTSTGGSTGTPVISSLSGLESYGRVAITYRMFAAHRLDLAMPMFQIRNKGYAANWTDALVFRKWGYPWLPEAELGDRIFVDFELPPAEQIARIETRAPAYLNTLPSNLLRLIVEARRSGRRPSVPAIFTVAEYLGPEVAAMAGETFGAKVVDILTSSEAGPIAIQCGESGLYHLQSERVLAEVLDTEGRPVAPGETGEVTVTPFYNYAMPLIRYRSGDFVVKGGPCPCGRSLPTIARFAGRREHMFRYPDGSARLPPIDRVRIYEALGHEAWQLAQTAPGVAVLRHEASARMPAIRNALFHQLESALGAGWTIELEEAVIVPKTKGGKRHFCVNETALRQ
jgi:phenylacetate-CoA ligase